MIVNKNINNIFYVKAFFWIVILIVLISLLFRFFSLISGSAFRNNSFSILYISKNSKVINVDEKNKSVSFISIGDARPIVKGRNSFFASVALGIPINGIIYDENKNLDPDFSEFISIGNEARMILSFNTSFKNLNDYDLHKVLSIARKAEKKDIQILNINIVKENDLEEKLEGAFLDKTIIDSNYTVEIVNGTEVNGLASSVASLLSLRGYNIVFLQTTKGKFDENSYVGYEFERNNFIDSLQKLTDFEEKTITISKTADVTIYLGSELETQFSD